MPATTAARSLVLLTCLLAAVSGAGSAAGFAQTWDFTTGAQGWTIYDTLGMSDYTSIGSGAIDTHTTGGNPGGFVSALDPSTGSFFFQAPISSADYSAFDGGRLAFSLQTDQTADFSADSVVIFRGGTGNLTIVSALGCQPGAAWTDYSLSLDASAFRVNNLSGAVVTATQFADVLGNLTGVFIPGEFHAGVTETTGLDSVTFLTAAEVSAIPEPSDFAFVAGVLGVGGAVGWRRRFRENQATPPPGSGPL